MINNFEFINETQSKWKFKKHKKTLYITFPLFFIGKNELNRDGSGWIVDCMKFELFALNFDEIFTFLSFQIKFY